MGVDYQYGNVRIVASSSNLPESKSDNDCLAFVNDDKYGEFLRKNNIAKPTGIIAYSGFNNFLHFVVFEVLRVN